MLILPYDWPHTHAALKVLHLLYRKEITYTLQPRFCKVDLMLNALIQLKIIQYWWWFWRQWCRDVASGIDRHPDRTEIDFRLQIQGNRKLIPCSRTFREVFNHPYISLFHLLVNGFSVTCVLRLANYNCNYYSILVIEQYYMNSDKIKVSSSFFFYQPSQSYEHASVQVMWSFSEVLGVPIYFKL